MHPVALAVMLRALPQGLLPGSAAALIDIAASVALSRVFFYLVERHFLNTAPGAAPR
jgi:peptidoglycan/LPS O-acetylase OafA/YrhL